MNTFDIMLYNIEAMAKINNYFKDRYDDDQAQFREKINRHRRFILYRILIAIVIYFAVIFLIKAVDKKELTLLKGMI